jgi:AhpD family alkylhydroperoxidase
MQARIQYRTLDPEALKALLALENYLAQCKLETSLIDLIRIRVSQINGCAYCLDMHIKDAQASGESDMRLFMISAWQESLLYTDRERAALEWAEAVTLLSENHIPDDLYERTRLHFTEQELISVTMAAIAINSWNRVNVSFRTQVSNYKSLRKPQPERVENHT